MTSKIVPTVPHRSALRTLYDQAVAEINVSRNGLLITNFYAKTGDAVFNAGYLEHVPPELNSVGFPGRSGWQILSALIRFWERERCRRPTLLIFEVE